MGDRRRQRALALLRQALEEHPCPICLSPAPWPVVFPCRHALCVRCMLALAEAARQRAAQPACPMCRRPLPCLAYIVGPATSRALMQVQSLRLEPAHPLQEHAEALRPPQLLLVLLPDSRLHVFYRQPPPPTAPPPPDPERPPARWPPGRPGRPRRRQPRPSGKGGWLLWSSSGEEEEDASGGVCAKSPA